MQSLLMPQHKKELRVAKLPAIYSFQLSMSSTLWVTLTHTHAHKHENVVYGYAISKSGADFDANRYSCGKKRWEPACIPLPSLLSLLLGVLYNFLHLCCKLIAAERQFACLHCALYFISFLFACLHFSWFCLIFFVNFLLCIYLAVAVAVVAIIVVVRRTAYECECKERKWERERERERQWSALKCNYTNGNCSKRL